MARPKKYASEIERRAAKLEAQRRRREAETGEAETIEAKTPPPGKPCDETPSGFIAFRHQPHVPLALFDGHGRGTVRTHTDGRQYVMATRQGAANACATKDF